MFRRMTKHVGWLPALTLVLGLAFTPGPVAQGKDTTTKKATKSSHKKKKAAVSNKEKTKADPTAAYKEDKTEAKKKR